VTPGAFAPIGHDEGRRPVKSELGLDPDTLSVGSDNTSRTAWRAGPRIPITPTGKGRS
jgi:hypothetical protein